VLKDAPSYRFMGFEPLFEAADFRFVKQTGSRRRVVLKDLDEATRL
jgi:hypothetical protein